MGLKPLYVFVFVLFYGVFLHAQSTIAPKYSNEFLQIGIGADALGRSNAIVAGTEGVNAQYWNPAGIVNTSKWMEVGAMHSEYFAGIAKYDYIGLSHKMNDKSALGLSFIRFGVDNIPNTTQLIDNQGNVDYDRITLFSAADHAFAVSYAQKLKNEKLRLGGTAKIVHRVVGTFAHSWGFGLDAGLQYEANNNWKFGVMARDVSSTFNAWVFTLDKATQDVFNATGNILPSNGLEITLPRFILATQAKFPYGTKGNYVASEIDVDLTTDGKRNVLISSSPFSIDPHMGIELGFLNHVCLRFGVGNMQYLTDFDLNKKLTIQPNIGVGISFSSFKLDYAFTDIGDNSTALYSHVFSIKFGLNKPDNAIK
jgi:hypothetical protein